MLVEILIAKAAERQGSKKAVAEMLGVSSSYLSDLKSGRRKIQPDDLAAIAHLAGMNALNFLALATLEQAKGTAKEKVLQEALGESIRQLESTLLSGSTPLKSSNSRDIQWGFTFTFSNIARWVERKYKLQGGFSQAKIGLWPSVEPILT
jgi:transcriptional regulator with XRE-family HTH domain